MVNNTLTTFSPANRRVFALLFASHLVWSALLLACWAVGSLLPATSLFVALCFIALQLYAAAQLVLPALQFHPEKRNRAFYLFWGCLLALSVWLLNQLPMDTSWAPFLAVLKLGWLLLVATLTGAVLAGFVRRLWEVVLVCLVITLVDVISWLWGPTSDVVIVLDAYYRHPIGPPPLIDMILVKLALPGQIWLAPQFGISDWIMVVWFALVNRHYGVNDNLIGSDGRSLARLGQIGGYLPVSVLALFAAVLLAGITDRFIPALPVISAIMLGWYVLRGHIPLGTRKMG